MTYEFSKKLANNVYIISQYLTRNQPYPRAYYPTYPTLPEEIDTLLITTVL